MKNYTNILLLIGSLIAFSCEDDDGSGDNYSVNADYVGDWMQTYFAQYDGEACSGIPDFVDRETIFAKLSILVDISLLNQSSKMRLLRFESLLYAS